MDLTTPHWFSLWHTGFNNPPIGSHYGILDLTIPHWFSPCHTGFNNPPIGSHYGILDLTIPIGSHYVILYYEYKYK